MPQTDELVSWGIHSRQDRDLLTPTIFHERWWLDIVTGGRWEVVESTRHGLVVGRMPFVRIRRWCFSVMNMPPLTHFLGPAVDYGPGSRNTRLLRQIETTRDLLRQLPTDIASFRQTMHRGIDNVVAFQMEGFATSVQFTYEIQPAPLEQVWRGMRDKTRNVFRKAAKTYSVDEDMEAEEFLNLYKANMSFRRWKSAFDLAFVIPAIIASRSRSCGQILVARDHKGAVKAAIFCVWDHSTCYYLLSTRSPDSGNGAITLLLWTAIQRAMAAGLVFDFDGLAHKGAVLLYSGFGATIKPRYIVSKRSRAFRLAQETRQCLIGPDNPFH